jgi:hypothetical protein
MRDTAARGYLRGSHQQSVAHPVTGIDVELGHEGQLQGSELCTALRFTFRKRKRGLWNNLNRCSSYNLLQLAVSRQRQHLINFAAEA